jgi:hypothetical protein
MRGLIGIVAAALVTVATPAVGQTPAAPAPSPTAKKIDSTNAYRGCVSAKPDAAGTFTLTQTGSGSRFRLTGKSMRDYAGKLVEVVLAEGKGITIKGGLSPSPNVAAQAGHLDSSQAAIARQPGANTGRSDADLPEFRVNRVRAVGGTCQP